RGAQGAQCDGERPGTFASIGSLDASTKPHQRCRGIAKARGNVSRTRSSDGRPARPTPHEDQDVDSWGDDVQSSDEAAAGGAADAEEAALDLEDLDRLDGDGAFH